MYSGLKTRIITDLTGAYFELQKGVRQEDPLSPILFNCLLEKVFRKLNWETEGININGELLNNLRFADDIILISNNVRDLEKMAIELEKEGREAGLIINLEKTKLISDSSELQDIELNGKKKRRLRTQYIWNK